MVATATKSPKTATHESSAASLVSSLESEAQKYQQLDQQFDDAIESDKHVMSAAEFSVRRICGYDVNDNDARREIVDKALRVKPLKKTAGTKQQFEAAKVAADKAREARKERIEQLQATIAASQIELNEIAEIKMGAIVGPKPTPEEHAAKNMQRARDELRKPVNLPPYVVQAYNDSSRFVGNDTSEQRLRISRLKTEMGYLNRYIHSSMVGYDQDDVIEYAKRNDPSGEMFGIRVEGNNSDGRTLYLSKQWEEHVEGLKERWAELESELHQLESQLIAQCNKVSESLLDFHLDKLG